MEIQKELSDLSLRLSDEEYYNSYELHHSTIARYEKEGFAGLSHLFDKIESPALTKGSILDCILTGDQGEFDRLFCIADIPELSDKMLQAADRLYENCHQQYATFSLIPNESIIAVADEFEIQKNWGAEKRIKTISDKCADYYNIKVQAGDRTVISKSTYDEVYRMVVAVRESPSTSGYFAENNEMSPIRRYYQQQFKAEIDGVGYLVKFDLIVVDYEAKKIIPVDLKSTGKPEYLFMDSFLYFRYDTQARLYYKVLSEVLKKDDYFKDFTIENFRFVVINKDSLTPLVWEFPYTKSVGTFTTKDGKEYRDPFEIGKELRGYLDCKPLVPAGISVDGINRITCFDLA